MLANDGTASGQVTRLIGGFNVWCNLLGNLVSQRLSLYQSTAQRPFQPFGSIRRKEGGESRLHNERLRDTLQDNLEL